MQQVVYVDVLFALNLIISFFVLSAVKRLLRESACAWRVLGGAVLGGLYSLAIFLPELPVYITVPVRAAFFIIVSFCVFGFGSVRRFLRCWATVLGANFLFAGVAAGVWFLFKPSSLALKNGAVYFDIGFIPLVLSSAACYAVLRLCGKYLSRRNSEAAECKVVIENLGKIAEAKGVIDTGNTLVDSFTGRKVSVVSQPLALQLLPQEYSDVVLDPLCAALPCTMHLIPANTVSGEGLMVALNVEKMKIFVEDKAYIIENATIAVSSEKVFSGGAYVLLNADIMFGAKIERYGVRKNEKHSFKEAEYAFDSSENQKHRRPLHKRAGDSAGTAECGTGAGDNEAHNAGR